MKTHYYYFYLTLAGLILTSCAKSVLTIKNNEGKYKVKEEMSVALTKKGEPYLFNKDCPTLCQSCDPHLDDARGIVESIDSKGITMQYGTEFKYDTLSFMQVRSMKKKERKKDLYKVIRDRPNGKFIYRRVLNYNTVVVPLDSLATITYSSLTHCSMMAKMKKPFSKPNKIYRANLEGAKVKVRE